MLEVYLVLLVVSLAVIAGSLYLWASRSSGAQPTYFSPVPPSTETTILIQTMRSLINDQKTLAKGLNSTIDRKLTLVREVVAKVVERQDAMLKNQEELTARLSRLEKNAGNGAKTVPPVEDPGPAFTGALAFPEEIVSGEEAQAWVAFADEEIYAEPEVEAVPEPPVAPHDAEAARHAFRQLLKLEEEGESGKVLNVASSGNGAPGNGPVRARVYEYYDAGVTISQIARELGLPKGQVALIIGLREKRRL